MPVTQHKKQAQLETSATKGPGRKQH
jgi:hypothetical protein